VLSPVHPSPLGSMAFDCRIRLIQKCPSQPIPSVTAVGFIVRYTKEVERSVSCLYKSLDPRDFYGRLSLTFSCHCVRNPPKYENIIVPLLIIAGKDD